MNVIEQLVWRTAEPTVMAVLEDIAVAMDERPNRLWASSEIALLMRTRQEQLKEWAAGEMKK